MTSPSLRTKRVVETPTLAVCGATGLPTSAPTEFRDGSKSAGILSNPPAVACNGAPVGRKNNKITSHETKMEVPPLSGVKLNVEAAALCVTDEIALTLHLCRLSPGRFT